MVACLAQVDFPSLASYSLQGFTSRWRGQNGGWPHLCRYVQVQHGKRESGLTARDSRPAGLLAGATEAVAVVTPMEVVKIRLQAQQHSLADPMDIPKYRCVKLQVGSLRSILTLPPSNYSSAPHAAFTIVKEEGLSTLYRGVTLTALRQATNQGVNFTAYQEFKKLATRYQPQYEGQLPSWQTMLLGLVSGAMGPFSNAPIDTIKTYVGDVCRVTLSPDEHASPQPHPESVEGGGRDGFQQVYGSRKRDVQARRPACILQGHLPASAARCTGSGYRLHCGWPQLGRATIYADEE